jgi:hypothetical protein
MKDDITIEEATISLGWLGEMGTSKSVPEKGKWGYVSGVDFGTLEKRRDFCLEQMNNPELFRSAHHVLEHLIIKYRPSPDSEISTFLEPIFDWANKNLQSEVLYNQGIGLANIHMLEKKGYSQPIYSKNLDKSISDILTVGALEECFQDNHEFTGYQTIRGSAINYVIKNDNKNLMSILSENFSDYDQLNKRQILENLQNENKKLDIYIDSLTDENDEVSISALKYFPIQELSEDNLEKFGEILMDTIYNETDERDKSLSTTSFERRVLLARLIEEGVKFPTEVTDKLLAGLSSDNEFGYSAAIARLLTVNSDEFELSEEQENYISEGMSEWEKFFSMKNWNFDVEYVTRKKLMEKGVFSELSDSRPRERHHLLKNDTQWYSDYLVHNWNEMNDELREQGIEELYNSIEGRKRQMQSFGFMMGALGSREHKEIYDDFDPTDDEIMSEISIYLKEFQNNIEKNSILKE